MRLLRQWLRGLSITRSVGDTSITKHGVVTTPDFTVKLLRPNEECLIVTRDAVWEFITSDEVLSFVAKEKDAGRRETSTETEMRTQVVACGDATVAEVEV